MGLSFFTPLKVCTETIKNSQYYQLKINRLHYMLSNVYDNVTDFEVCGFTENTTAIIWQKIVF